ncbi:STAS domain-containing protein [Pseudalkalibacillus caeni]|uniref:STAS domain-containing protein n=1 Tax=Exobacillus caeni TaxID=2574798 RepID=A0A5R9F3M2_9BACL|nr:STAS domain-containing protein [Pseudalkalibacillus caeni]TLS38282.1 STAS domain-containing protein [Pseudalkalibacillus caeni]
MEKYLVSMGEKISESRFELSKRMSKMLNLEYQRSGIDSIIEEESLELRASLIKLIGEMLQTNDPGIEEQIINWSTDTARKAIDVSIPLEKATKAVPIYRKVIWDAIKEEAVKNSYPLEAVFDFNCVIDPLLDRIVYAFSHVYIEDFKETINTAKQELDELSIPVVPLTKDIAVLPVVGTIDTHRARLMNDRVLKRCTELKLSNLIIDLSGVHIIDTLVAHHLFNVIKALSLLGIRTIISGLRPELAQTIVSLGIDFSEISTFASLRQALNTMDINY